MSYGILRAGDLSDSTMLYRYVGLSQFLSFVEHKQIRLTKIKDWDDTWEAPLSRLPGQNADGKLEYPTWTISDDMFGLSWTLNNESDALWRIYSVQEEGLLIQTTVAKFDLLREIEFGLLAPVVYFEDLHTALNDLKAKEGYDSLFSEAFLKRKAFEHEQEVRLITINNNTCLGTTRENSSHIYMNLDPLKFIEDITIDPRADDRYVKTMKEYCKRAGFEIVPKKSTLYSSGVFESTGLTMSFMPKKRSRKI